MSQPSEIAECVGAFVNQMQSTSDPSELLLASRRVLSHFINIFARECENAELINHFLITLQLFEQAIERIAPGEQNCRDVFKGIEALLEIVRQNKEPAQVIGVHCILNAVGRVIARLEREEWDKVSKALERKLRSLNELYNNKANGSAMYCVLNMMHNYICKFFQWERDEVAARLLKMFNDPHEKLLEMAQWTKENFDSNCRQILNRVSGDIFYLLAVRSATVETHNFSPHLGCDIILVEWSKISTAVSFSSLSRQGSNNDACYVSCEFEEILEYEFSKNSVGPCMNITTPGYKLCLQLCHPEELGDLKQFLNPVIGFKEVNAAECKEELLRHIRLNDTSPITVRARGHVTPFPALSAVIPDDLTTAKQHLRSAVDPPPCRWAVRTDRERKDVCPSPTSSEISEDLMTDEQRTQTAEEYARLNGLIGVSKLAQLKGPLKPSNGVDNVYDFENSRWDGRTVPPSVVKKRGCEAQTNTKGAATRRNVQTDNFAMPSMVKFRGRKSSTPRPNSEQLVALSRSNLNENFGDVSAIHGSDSEEVLEEDDGLDPSWKPKRKRQAAKPNCVEPKKGATAKAPTNRKQNLPRSLGAVKVRSKRVTKIKQGSSRRDSVMSRETFTYENQKTTKLSTLGKQSLVSSDSDESLKWEHLKQQLEQNKIFDEDNSTESILSGGRKRKSGPCNDHANDETTSEQRPTRKIGTNGRVPPNGSILPSLKGGAIGERPNLAKTYGSQMNLVPMSVASTNSADQLTDASMNEGPATSKLQHVLKKIVGPTVDDLCGTLKRNVAEVKNSVQEMLDARGSRYEAIVQKHKLFIQQQRAATLTLSELMQMGLDYKRSRTDDLEMDRRIKEAEVNDRKFMDKLKHEQAKIENVVEAATVYDWDTVKMSFAKSVQNMLFQPN